VGVFSEIFPAELLMAEVNDHDLIVTPQGREVGIFDRPNKKRFMRTMRIKR